MNSIDNIADSNVIKELGFFQENRWFSGFGMPDGMQFYSVRFESKSFRVESFHQISDRSTSVRDADIEIRVSVEYTAEYDGRGRDGFLVGVSNDQVETESVLALRSPREWLLVALLRVLPRLLRQVAQVLRLP